MRPLVKEVPDLEIKRHYHDAPVSGQSQRLKAAAKGILMPVTMSVTGRQGESRCFSPEVQARSSRTP
jgi:hypothetical protein